MEYPHIVKTEGTCSGLPRVDGTRISVNLIVREVVHLRWSPEEVLVAHPHLTMAQIHSALAYYWDHREEVEASIKERAVLVEDLRTKFPSKLSLKRLDRSLCRVRDRKTNALPPHREGAKNAKKVNTKISAFRTAMRCFNVWPFWPPPSPMP